MKQGIHPEYVTTEVTCSCGNTFTTRSTAKTGQLHAEVCSACHPFYTGKQKIMDVGGRVDKFERRFGKRSRPRERISRARQARGGRRVCLAVRRVAGRTDRQHRGLRREARP